MSAAGCGLVMLSLSVMGCDESQDAATVKETAQSVNTAQRLIRASQDKLPLTEAEIDQAWKNETERDRKRQAKNVADRMIREIGVADFEKTLSQIEQLSAEIDSPDDAKVNLLCERLLSASGDIIRIYNGMGNIAGANSRKRLLKAEEVLADAIKTARQNNNRDAQVAPQITLGVIQLIRGRDGHRQLRDKGVSIGKKQITINHLAGSARVEQGGIVGFQWLPPEKAISMLEIEKANSQGMLIHRQNNLQALNTKLKQVQQDLDFNSTKARQIHRQYLALLEQADKVRGQKKYQLQQEAYILRVGTDENPGGIYYESQTELIENQLSIVQSKVEFEDFSYQQLSANIINIEQAINRLRTSPQTTTDIDSLLSNSLKEKERLVSLLGEKLTQLKKAEDGYRQSRVEVVGAYNKAIEAFSNAVDNARRGSATRKYAEKLVDMCRGELAQLWLADATFYDGAALVIAMAHDIEETEQITTPLSRDYKSQADQARASAADLAVDKDSEE